MILNNTGRVWDGQAVVPAGTTLLRTMPARGNPMNFQAKPVAAGSVLVEFTCSPLEHVNDNTALWSAIGTYSDPAAPGGADSLAPITALRFTATGADAVVAIAQRA